MVSPHPHQESIERSLDKVKEIMRSNPLTRETLEQAKNELLKLAASADWWAEDRYPAPPEGERQARYLISEEPDQTFALYLNVMRPGKRIPPHNHTTWACIAAVEGEEHNYLYRRLDDGSKPGYAKLEETEQIIIGPGNAVAMLPDDIHSVQIMGDKVIRHLHMYGRSLETLNERIRFDLDNDTYEIMPVGVQTQRVGA